MKVTVGVLVYVAAVTAPALALTHPHGGRLGSGPHPTSPAAGRQRLAFHHERGGPPPRPESQKTLGGVRATKENGTMDPAQLQPPEPDVDPAEEKAWINRLILLHERPLPGEMSEQQHAGEQCMWCSAGDPTELRPLNGMLPVWQPRACPPCIEARGVKVKTFAVWAEHVADCTACQLGGRCPAAMPLAEAHAAAVDTATGSKLVNLICCKVQEDVHAGAGATRYRPPCPAGR
ncbi:hypothetical protein [Streptomyces sp. AM6-12]|uniref:hypothetical protein n=1 Tax=Streptomyces sp. AM6-12 TaxID=3345149 RepID=UPI00379190D7